jgi:hypothetical protein
MKALSFWKAVTLDKSDLLDEVFALLQDNGVRFCVIGGQAVNAYVEPLVSLDLDLVVAVGQLDQVGGIMRRHCQLSHFCSALMSAPPAPVCVCSFRLTRVMATFSSELPSETFSDCSFQ